METFWFILGGLVVVAAFLLIQRRGLISKAEARRLLSEGARVIDVRRPAEFARDHLSQAVNVPLDDLAARIGKLVPDAQTPILLHCQGGVRSGMARRVLEKRGYTRAYNLGSLGRARRIVTPETPC